MGSPHDAQTRTYRPSSIQGRTWGNVDEEIKEIGFDGYICGCGTYVLFREKWAVKKSLPHPLCVSIVEQFPKVEDTSLL